VDVPFEQRWRRFDRALSVLGGMLRDARPGGIPLWVASWGSAAGLRRIARFGDGWIASGYNATPDAFRDRLAALRQDAALRDRRLPNALATTWSYVTEDAADAERMLADTLAPMLNRPVDALRHLPIGPAEVCARNLAAFAAAGVERVLLWPLADPVRQLELVMERVVPQVPTGT
jgi:alkanesulfonate monooxygenase SsuD/methylene tetrahydromethanopterin reductase-like flavin-dependent oxidoreductase (luciferase family)